MLEISLNVFYVLFSIFVSAIFWVKDSNSTILRLLNSIHSILLLFILVLSGYIGLELHIYNNQLFYFIFVVLLLLSIFSILTGFYSFTGPKYLLLFHSWNLFALILTFFIGTMSLTNDWL